MQVNAGKWDARAEMAWLVIGFCEEAGWTSLGVELPRMSPCVRHTGLAFLARGNRGRSASPAVGARH